MEIEGGCYCGAVRFKAAGDPMFKGQCHCRECQYYASGSVNVFVALPDAGFSYTKGAAKGFSRSDLDNPVTREFCADCGTPILSRAPSLPGTVILKAGVFDDPSQFGDPQVAIYTIDKQSFHHIADGVATFERTPG